jgi:hypothetical protein
MGDFSFWHWVLFIGVILTLVVPYWKIFPRAGWPAPLALLMVVSPVGLILLWVLAFKTWPGDKRPEHRVPQTP